MQSLRLLIFLLLPLCADAGVLHPDALPVQDDVSLSHAEGFGVMHDSRHDLVQIAFPGFELPAVHLIGDVFSMQSALYAGIPSGDFPVQWIGFAGRLAHAPRSRASAAPSLNRKVGGAHLYKVSAPSGAIALITAILLLPLRGKTSRLGASRYQRLLVRRQFTRQARY